VPDPAVAAALLRSGALLAHATRGLLGIAADPLRDDALDRLDAIKQRRNGEGYVLVAGAAQHCKGWFNPHAWFDRERAMGVDELLATAWSGPVTWVLPAGPRVPRRVQARDGTVALRVDSHPAVQALAHAFGRSWISTSLNFHGAAPASTWSGVPAALARCLDGVLTLGPAPLGQASTLARLDAQGVTVLRQGAVPAAELARASGSSP
jgi:L-threonylcarbamoyladenylate synthase